MQDGACPVARSGGPAPRFNQAYTMNQPKKPNNTRTGLILGGVALFFFVMVFVKHIWLS